MPFTFDTSFVETFNFDPPCPVVIYPKKFWDDRGCFLELYKESEFIQNGIGDCFEQDNMSVSRKNVLRGLHFQRKPKEQGKLIRVIRGGILDVAVDIRPTSKSYKKYITFDITPDNCKMVYIPPGYAHGFLSLEDNTVISYKCTNEYDHACDAGIRWDDPDIGIAWPKNIRLILSDKDSELPFLKDIEATL